MPTTGKLIETGPKVEDVRQLRIADVVCMTGGRIGICRLPGRYGKFATDINEIKRWAPAAVVTMTTQKEMEQANAADLSEQLETLGIRWVHLPVADYGGIGDENARKWPDISKELHKLLNTGGGVLIHCRGGHGRSGMVALKLLVEQGEPPADAVSRIRKARPGAIETDEQMAWGEQVM